MFKLYNNYIPHKKNCSFDRWYEEYENQLINIYSIMIEILLERYGEENIDDITFIKFCRFIYNSSSQYILKY